MTGMMGRWLGLVVSSALLIALLAANSTAHLAAAGQTWCVSVWYPSAEHPGGYQSILDHAAVIDEINPFWYAANPDGSLLLQNDAENAEKLAVWRTAGLRILPSVANASPFAISDPDTRARHIDALTALVERMDYDGIDIDYEEFPLATRDDFSAFIEALASELHTRGRLVSVTVHAKTTDQPAWEGAAAQDWERLVPAVDIFRIMTYDYHSLASREPGPIGPPQWVLDVLAYAASVTSLDKVRLGVHFYGYRWQRGTAAIATWESTQRALEKFGLAYEYEPGIMEAVLKIAVVGLPKQTIYVADAVGLEFKLEQVLAAYPDLGGLAIWGIGGEDPALWDVVQRYRQGECHL
jgi:spore germination protein